MEQISKQDYQKLRQYLIKSVSESMELGADGEFSTESSFNQALVTAYRKTKLTLEFDTVDALFYDVRAEMIGYGPIQALLDDPEINEIMVVGANQVYCERNGILEDSEIVFSG